MLLHVEIMNFGKPKSAESKLQIQEHVASVAVCATAPLERSRPHTTEHRGTNPAGLQDHDLVSLPLRPDPVFTPGYYQLVFCPSACMME